MFRSASISTFYRLIFVLSDKFSTNTKYGMWNSKTGRKRFALYPDRFRISRIWSGYPVFTNSKYPVFYSPNPHPLRPWRPSPNHTTPPRVLLISARALGLVAANDFGQSFLSFFGFRVWHVRFLFWLPTPIFLPRSFLCTLFQTSFATISSMIT